MPPRAILPKDEQSSSGGHGHTPPPKTAKRKAISSACIPCRKRKSKCDGGQPSCSTCVAVYRTECNYDQDTDHRRKGALRKDIQSLQVKNNALDVVMSSLRAMPEAEATALFQSIRRGERLDTLAETIGSGDTDLNLRTLDADLSEHIGTPSSSFHASTPLLSSDNPKSPERMWGDLQQIQESSPEKPSSWFRVPQDADFVDHLLNLYFSWSHPYYTFFSKDHFLKDMARGGTKHCSPLLVNAILALACSFSDRPAARTDPSKPETAGDYFFKEAMDLDRQTDEASLTTVQAIAVMAVREASAGRDHVGYRLSGRCIRMAMELGLHLAEAPGSQAGLRPTDAEIRKITFWGIFNLEMGCCLSLGRPSSLTRNTISVEKPSSAEKLDTLVWQPYEDVNLPVSPSALHPMKCLLYTQHFSKLSEIINDVNLNLYAPRERFTARRLAAAYNQYQAWYNDMPEVFHLRNTAMPHVIVMHMYYYMCVLHLFRPFMKLDLQAIGLYPREICNYCATEISSLMNALRGMYGLRRISLSVTVILLSASTVHLLHLPSQTSATHLTQALHDLQAMSVNHRYAGCCIEIIHRLANQWGIALPESARAMTPFLSTMSQQHAFPNMPVFFTQATLSSESIDTLSGSGSSRHDSGSIYEPSFIQHSYTVLPHHPRNTGGSDQSMQPPSSRPLSLHSTPLNTTPIPGAQGLWSTFPTQQVVPDVHSTDFQMMNDPSAFAFNNYGPSS